MCVVAKADSRRRYESPPQKKNLSLSLVSCSTLRNFVTGICISKKNWPKDRCEGLHDIL